MTSLAPAQQRLIEPIERQPMIDQVLDWAQRQSLDADIARRLLAPALG